MNAPVPDQSRRRFLTGLFAASDSSQGRTELRPVAGLPARFGGVLWAVAADRPDNIFVAGDDGCIFHYDGEQWFREQSAGKLNIHALCCSGERVFSVGWLGQICVREDGAWQTVQGGSSDAATINQPLFDIETAANGQLWAAGDNGRICQFDGAQWIEHNSGATANLRCVLPLEDGRVLAAGLGGTALEYDGVDWQSIASNTGCAIVSMAALDDTQIIAVGGEYSIETNQFVGRIFLYDGDEWSAVATDYTLPRLRRVRREGVNLLITGDGGAAFRWTGEGVTKLPTRVRYDLHDAISFEDGRALICGDEGTILEEAACDAEQSTPTIVPVVWQQLSNGETNKTLRSIWPIDDHHLVAAGDSGTVVHINDQRITVHKTPGGLCIHDLWGSSPRNIFAVCDSATILHFDGESWDIAHRGTVDTALLAITGFGPHDIFAVGDSGYALRYDGLMWRQIETGVKQELYGVWGYDSQHLLAVGGGGLILRWDGERWKSFGAGTDQDLYGVHGCGLNKLFICGLAGVLTRFEDNAWHKEFTGVRSDLHAVSGHGSEFYVVGSNGTVLHSSDGVWDLEDSGCDNTLQAVAVNGSTVLAVGSGGTILRRVIPS